jgi:hypothetical protein
VFITFAICTILTVHTQHSFDHVLNSLRKGSGLGEPSQAARYWYWSVGQRFAAGSGRHRYRSGFAIALLVIVEACIGRTDLQQQAWIGEGAIMDGTRQVRMMWKEEAYFVVNNSATAQMYLTGHLLG